MGWRRRFRRHGESTSGIDEECECGYVFLLLTSVVVDAKINQCPKGSNPPPFAVAASIRARADSSSASTFILSK